MLGGFARGPGGYRRSRHTQISCGTLIRWARDKAKEGVLQTLL